MPDWWIDFLAYAGTEDGERAIKGVLAILALIGGFLLWFFGVIGKLWKLLFGAKEEAADTPIQQVRDNVRGGFAEADQAGIATGQVFGDQTIHQGAPVGHITLTSEQFVEHLERERDKARAKLAKAHESEKAQLHDKISELERQLANPDEALAEAEKTIADLTARLERMGNEIGGARLAEARAALERLDFSVADEIFAEVEARQELAVQESARAAFGRGEVAEAEVRWADAAAHYARSARLASDFSAMKKAAEFAWRSGDYTAAAAQGAALVACCKEHGTQEELATALNAHALNHKARGDLAEAERLYRQALRIGKATIGETHPAYATRLNNLAGVLRARGDLAEAERLYAQALEIDKATLGEAHPGYAIGLNNLALVLRARGELAEAERLCRQALEIDKATIGEAHPDHAIGLNNLAGVLLARGDLVEAERLFRQALEIDRAALGEAHPGYATDLNNLAHVLETRGDLAAAERMYREALKIDRAALGEAHPQYANHAINLANLLAQTGRPEEAGPLFEAGLKVREAALGDGHPDTVMAREALAAFREGEAEAEG